MRWNGFVIGSRESNRSQRNRIYSPASCKRILEYSDSAVSHSSIIKRETKAHENDSERGNEIDAKDNTIIYICSSGPPPNDAS